LTNLQSGEKPSRRTRHASVVHAVQRIESDHAAALYVNVAPLITLSPSVQEVASGETAIFTVTIRKRAKQALRSSRLI